MEVCASEVKCLGQAAGRLLQDGLADVEGGAFARPGRAVADRNADRSCGVLTTQRRRPYARVSSADPKEDLDRQLARLTEFALSKRLPIVKAVKEVGSGLNGRRKGMIGLLRDPKVGVILVEHRDRLMRFGFEYLEAALAAQSRSVLVVDPDERTDDIVRELHEVMVSLCARLYGKRSAQNRVKKALEAIHE